MARSNMVDLAPTAFSQILRSVIDTQEKVTSPKLADELGVNPRVFRQYLEGDRHCPAQIIPKMCLLLNDFRALDALEHGANRVGFHVLEHEHDHLAAMDFLHVQRLVKEVGDALTELGATLADGIVERHEVERTVPELNHVIRECVRLKHWLEKRMHHDEERRRRRET